MVPVLVQVSAQLMSLSWQQIRANFFRRYKWAFRSEYNDITTPVVVSPNFNRFRTACNEICKASLI